MRKCDSKISVCGYRYAPESFQAAWNNKAIQFSTDERFRCGYVLCTRGAEAAIEEVKKILRFRDRNAVQYVTIGFREKGNPRTFHYTRDLPARVDSLPDRLRVYKEFKQFMLERGCAVHMSTTAELDGAGKIVSKEENIVQVDINLPCTVVLYREYLHGVLAK